jgi:Uma2 family endonuclease
MRVDREMTGGRVFVVPQMKLGRSGREPDVLFVSNENQARVEGMYLNGPADLAVEIVSPESRGRDRKEKLREYEQAGVREYWIVDAVNRQAEFYALNADGTYDSLPIVKDVFQSRVIEGLWLDVKWLWQDPLPNLMVVLKAWSLV